MARENCDRVTREDFLACEELFSRPLPELFRFAATCLDDINLAEGGPPILERLCLLLDQLGVECWKWPILILNLDEQNVADSVATSCD